MKTYTTGMPCGSDGNDYKMVETNLQTFNYKKRKGILTAKHYVDWGDTYELQKDGQTILYTHNVLELLGAVQAIIGYTRRD